MTTTLPTPADFPVAWRKPGDEQLFWTLDRMHFPGPLTALEYELVARFFKGMIAAAEAFELGLVWETQWINTYIYYAVYPSVPPDEVEALARRSEEKIRPVMARLADIWNREYLPEIQGYLADWAAFDLRGAADAALLSHLDRSLGRLARISDIHFTVGVPVYVAVSQFDDLFRDLFGGDGAFGGYRLLQGFDNKTLETGRALWALSRRALASAAVRRVLEERSSSEVIPALGQFAEGRAFLAELDAYLEEYGQRGQTCLGFGSSPSWIEDPTPVIKNLKDYMTQPGDHPGADLGRLAEERVRLVAEARAKLRGYPQPVVDQFETLLAAAQAGNVLTEDHGFWIDYRSLYQVRRVFLELGRRLADRGLLETAGDAWHLTIDEIRASLVSGIDRRTLVEARKADVERFSRVVPPPALGTPPPGPPPDTSLGRTMAKFFGEPPQPEAGAPANVLKGHAGSPGTVRAAARLVRSLADAGRLQKGEVLVAETTSAPWTPLFATASAIVTDAGGVLSHCAVVAREYRIPAVVGTLTATARIADGQMLEVDGDAGVVRLL
jgi:pyruvate,water dikinase